MDAITDHRTAAFESLAGLGVALRGSWSPEIDRRLLDALRQLAMWAAETRDDIRASDRPGGRNLNNEGDPIDSGTRLTSADLKAEARQ